jgi:hypothetical protein
LKMKNMDFWGKKMANFISYVWNEPKKLLNIEEVYENEEKVTITPGVTHLKEPTCQVSSNSVDPCQELVRLKKNGPKKDLFISNLSILFIREAR